MVLSPKDLDLSPMTPSTVEENIDAKLKQGQYVRYFNTLDISEPELKHLTDDERLQLIEKYLQMGWKYALISEYVSGFVLHLTLEDKDETDRS